MKSRLATVVITLACLGYAVLSIQRVVAFAQTGNLADVALAASASVVVAFSVVLIAREIRFGVSMNRMAVILEAEDLLLPDSLPKTVDGRVEREAADARFALIAAEAETQPDSWRAWYRLAIAYDDARDRKRARAAMRTAEKLFRN